jgi:ribosomal protein S18 acetylase RimI-like enzyme
MVTMAVEIRRAVREDLNFLQDLAAQSFQLTAPDTRPGFIECASEQAREAISDLLIQSLSADSPLEILVAQYAEGGERAGYIIVEYDHEDFLTGMKEAFIVDLAVAKRYWGKYIVNRLVDAASLRAKERGLSYLVGIVSRSNARALGTALKALRFVKERYQVVKRL